MTTDFQIKALNDQTFSKLFKLSDSELETRGVQKMIVNSFPGFPCRISLEDAEIGEEVILLNFEHHKVNSPYRASGPIFIRKTPKTAILNTNEIPKMLKHRLLSLRGYNELGIMIEAVVTEGENLKEQINKIFENSKVSYIHIHNAKPGCFNCLVERS